MTEPRKSRPSGVKSGSDRNRWPRWASRTCLALLACCALVWLLVTRTGQVLGQPNPSATRSEMDQAIALLSEARLHYRDVQDYQCRLIKRERIKGVLQPESVLTMKLRNKPYSVYLYCESPDADKGMEVSYVAGRNHGMMRVHPAGMLGILGFWSVDVQDPRAFEKSRHCITEAGFGTLLESTARYWEMERRLNKTVVHITDEEVGGRACKRIETVHPDRSAGAFYGYRCVLWLDKATHLPVGAEMYDWPSRGGAEGGVLLESYRFLDLRRNIGLKDDDFPQ